MNHSERIHKKLSEIRGRVIHASVDIESCLTTFLVDYFYKKNCKQKHELHWLVINPRRFDDKIELFEDISYFQKKAYYQQTKSALRSVQRLRNAVAHWEAHTSKSSLKSIYLSDPHSITKYIRVDEKMLKEFEKDADFLVRTLLGSNFPYHPY